MIRNPYDVSDGCFALVRVLNGYVTNISDLAPADLVTFTGRITELGSMANDMAMEISRHRWNDLARREAAERAVLEARERHLLIEASRPDSNLVLLMTRRPQMDGGRNG